MKSSLKAIVVLGALLGLAVTTATASPVINSAVIHLRVFNDDSDSTVTFSNGYPASLWIQDANLDGDGQGSEYANRHNFRLSSNGFNPAIFNNGDSFSFFTDVTLTGTADEEGGINVSPWWSQDVDGTFTAITGNGEIAAFGGRLPFYSFNNHVPPVNYVKGETIRLGVIYDPHSLTQADPATIEYIVIKNATQYSSGPVAFDEGNGAEGYGTWGMLNNAEVGGYFQPQIQVGNVDNWGRVDFGNMVYTPEPASLMLLGLAGVVMLGRKR
jgi:hypothetical protein